MVVKWVAMVILKFLARNVQDFQHKWKWVHSTPVSVGYFPLSLCQPNEMSDLSPWEPVWFKQPTLLTSSMVVKWRVTSAFDYLWWISDILDIPPELHIPISVYLTTNSWWGCGLTTSPRGGWMWSDNQQMVGMWPDNQQLVGMWPDNQQLERMWPDNQPSVGIIAIIFLGLWLSIVYPCQDIIESCDYTCMDIIIMISENP